jgi:hypothetical protein
VVIGGNENTKHCVGHAPLFKIAGHVIKKYTL